MTERLYKYLTFSTPRLLSAVAIPLMPLMLASCFSARNSSAGGEVTGVGGSAWAEPTPYGMVLVDRGSIAMGPSKDDSITGIKANPRGISVDAFWMDGTEVKSEGKRS